MEGTNLINKAGMFDSDDAWSFIPLIQEKSKMVNLTSKFGFGCFQCWDLVNFAMNFCDCPKLVLSFFKKIKAKTTFFYVFSKILF